jgi:chorismate mutase
MTVCRGIRGATTVEDNTKEAIFAATEELFNKIVEANHIEESQVASVFFTTTQDLNAAFPATAVRKIGWTHTALLCGHEMAVPGSLPGCIRILILVNTDKAPQDLVNVYLRGAVNLRSDSPDSTEP